MRLIKALFGLAFVVIGVLFGALNRQLVTIDLGFSTLTTSLGFGLLCTLLLGALLGGLVALAGSLRPRRPAAKAVASEPPVEESGGPAGNV